jgi:hypothetical protein
VRPGVAPAAVAGTGARGPGATRRSLAVTQGDGACGSEVCGVSAEPTGIKIVDYMDDDNVNWDGLSVPVRFVAYDSVSGQLRGTYTLGMN